MSSRLTLLEAAHSLKHCESASMLRPNLHNPASAEGCTLQITTRATLDEFIASQRCSLIALTHLAQNMVVYAANGGKPVTPKPMELAENREATDMYWHTDKAHRNYGSVMVVEGASPIPTQLAPQWLVHGHLRRQMYRQGVLRDTKLACAHLLRDPDADNPFTQHGALYMHLLYDSTKLIGDYRDQTKLAAFWNDINEIGRDPDVVSVGEVPSEHEGCNQAVFTSIMSYHRKGFDPGHAQGRPGAKRRHELISPSSLREGLQEQFAYVWKSGDKQDIDADWFHDLGKQD